MRRLGILTAIFAGIFIHTLVFAAVPTIINYQGRLTDRSGAPVPDGSYGITFSIYKGDSGGTAIWTSNKQTVSVAGGLFTYDLGSNVPFPDGFFTGDDRWLGITIETDAELTPRIRLNTVPHAYQSLTADTADFADLANFANELSETGSEDFLKQSGDTLSGNLYFNELATSGALYVYSDGVSLAMREHDSTKVYLTGVHYGTMDLYNPSAIRTATIDARSSTGGAVTLRNAAGDLQIQLSAGVNGDNSAFLRDNAINSDEILDEPGIAFQTGNSSVNLIYDEVIDIETVSIAIPASGYVHVTADYTVALWGTTLGNGAYLQVDRLPGGLIAVAQSNRIYLPSSANTSTTYHCGSTSYVFYFDSPGTHTFRLEALKSTNNGQAAVNRCKLTAMYFPSSYEAVKTITADPVEYGNSEPVTIVDDDGVARTYYETDLRQLELRAKQAKIEAQEAFIKQLELERQLENATRSRE